MQSDGAPESINVRIKGPLKAHLRQQIAAGLYDNASEYLRALIRADYQEQRTKAASWLNQHLAPALSASPEEFVSVSAADVVKRNQK